MRRNKREDSAVLVLLHPISCLLRWPNQTLGRIPRSVREKCAEQPGLLSVDALKQTINTGPVLQSKLKARRSVLTILREAFCSSAAFSKKKRKKKEEEKKKIQSCLFSFSVHMRK